MSPFLTTDRSGAIPIMAVRKDNLPAWLEQHLRSREWLSRIGFRAEPGTFAFLPDADGRVESIIASPATARPVYAFAGLPSALPEGKYVLQMEEQGVSPADAALGWAFGSYQFYVHDTKRAPATLVWPEDAVGMKSSVVRAPCFSLATSSVRRRGMGPEHLADAVSKVADPRRQARRHRRRRSSAPELSDDPHGRRARHGRLTSSICGGGDRRPRPRSSARACASIQVASISRRLDGMLQRKRDMGGATVALALADTLMYARTPIQLRVLIPAVEDSVTGNAFVRSTSCARASADGRDRQYRSRRPLILCDPLAEPQQTPRPSHRFHDAHRRCARRARARAAALHCYDDRVADGMLESGCGVGDPLSPMPSGGPPHGVGRRVRRPQQRREGEVRGLDHRRAYLAVRVTATRSAHLDVVASTTVLAARPARGWRGDRDARALRLYQAAIRIGERRPISCVVFVNGFRVRWDGAGRRLISRDFRSMRGMISR